ncbi:HD domain-containing protein [Candidatus Margulisiibacteriota bacterium]
MNIVHRIKQFIAAIQAELYPEDVEFIRKHLTKQEQILFYRMPTVDQCHSLNVAYRLQNKIREVELRQHQPINMREEAVIAALLHDVGKVEAPFSLPARILYVVARKLFYNLGLKYIIEKGEKSDASKLFRNFYVLEYHPLIGAHLLEQINVNPDSVTMIAKHQEDINLAEPLVFNLLKEADEDI